MGSDHSGAGAADWANRSGSVWARRWQETDRGLAGLSPHLLRAIEMAAPDGSFAAFDIGCGPASTSIDVASVCSAAQITACDVSADLAKIARQRTANVAQIKIVEGDAEALVAREGPFDLLYSRHGVMFFPDPVRAFRAFRSAATPGASVVFSCFQSWEANPWASELASAAMGTAVPAPGREPSGFAFTEPDYVVRILSDAGWVDAKVESVRFRYETGQGSDPVETALSFFLDIGPASRVVQSLPDDERPAAVGRLRAAIERYKDGDAVAFPAAACIWSARTEIA